MKRIFLIGLISFFTTQIFAQEFSFMADYTLGSSSIKDEQYFDFKPKISQQLNVRIGFELMENLSFTAGLGYLNVGEVLKIEYENHSLLEWQKNKFSYSYITIPLGLKYSLKSFFILPEIGLGIQSGFKHKIVNKRLNGDKTKEDKSDFDQGELKSMVLPLSIMIGYEHDMGDMKAYVGLRLFSSMSKMVDDNPRDYKYRGFGLVVGVRL